MGKKETGSLMPQRRFLSILAKTLPPATMGFEWTGTAVSLPKWMRSLYSSLFVNPCINKKILSKKDINVKITAT
jgi:hypothetical protein